MTDTTLVDAARRLHEGVRLARGQGNTRHFATDFSFASISDLEYVALGLRSDESGLQDVLERAKTVNEGSRALNVHLEAVLRARLFKLLASIAKQYVDTIEVRRKQETSLNVLLSLMAGASDVIFTRDEARRVADGFNLFAGSTLNADQVLDAAVWQIGLACQKCIVGSSHRLKSRGLVGYKTAEGVRLRYVPTQYMD